MEEIQLSLDERQHGAFIIEEGQERVAEMVIAIRGGNLIVYHTEVSDKLKGQGVASKLLAEMVKYAREYKLKVVPLCPYVSVQFNRHPEQYADIWDRNWHK